MNNEARFSELLIPLIARGEARRLWPQLGFVDEAAEYLVDTLAIDFSIFGRDLLRQKNRVAQCAWVDKKMLAFIARYPHTFGVEFGGGLNTRFWRLCRRLEWPLIRWLDVDSAEVLALKEPLFPSTDNYQQMGLDQFAHITPERLGWEQGRPLILVVDMNATPLDVAVQDINARLIASAGPVALLLHNLDDRRGTVINQIKCHLGFWLPACKSAQLHEGQSTSFLQRCLAYVQRRQRSCVWLEFRQGADQGNN